MVFGEFEIIGSRYASRRQVAEAAELVASGAVEPIVGTTSGPSGPCSTYTMSCGREH